MVDLVTHNSPFFGLGPFGVWHSDRPFLQDFSHMTDLELSYTNSVARGRGTGVRGAIGGFTGSSSRSELTGAIVTTFSPIPVHAGIDNSSVALGSQKMVVRLLSNPTPLSLYFWGNYPNCDL